MDDAAREIRPRFACSAEAVLKVVTISALDRHPHLVILTGGLGPAPDDVTLAGVSETLGQPLSASTKARELVEAAYRRMVSTGRMRSSAMTLAREKMCKIPVGGTPLPNEKGIAPGVLCKLPGGSAVICLPGAPDEAIAVLRDTLHSLQEILPQGHTALQEVEAPSPDEAALRPLLEQMTREFPGLWISSRPVKSGRAKKPGVLISLEANAPSEEEAAAVVSAAVRRLLAIAGGSR
jgi:nicotinamide-nucleotide amidase